MNSELKYAIIINHETTSLDCLCLDNLPEDMAVEEYIEETLDYSLSNCSWSCVDKLPVINNLNY